MKLNDLDQKVLKNLNLDGLPEEEKQKALKRLDEALMNRFMVNILTSLPKEKQEELERKAEELKDGQYDKFLEEAINLHPDAKAILEKSAEEIIGEFKENKQQSPDSKPQIDQKLQASTETKDQPATKMQTPTPDASPDYYQAE
jgi:MoxR-like ATPase